jgi:hypothetical protein
VLTTDDPRRPVLVRRGFILEYLTPARNGVGIVVLLSPLSARGRSPPREVREIFFTSSDSASTS